VTDTLECIKDNTYNLNETIEEAVILPKEINLLVSSFWDTDLTVFSAAQCHTLNNSYTIGTDMDHMLRISVTRNKTFHVFIHDPKLTTLNFNPETFPDTKLTIMENNGLQLFYIKAMRHNRLRTPSSSCEDSEQYSFKSCVRNSVSRQIGCRLPWDKWTDPTSLPKCSKVDQMNMINRMLYSFLYISKEAFFTKTGCIFPCQFIQYEVVGQPTMLDQSQQGLMVLMASAEMTELIQTTVYPFESFLAEFGGALGLFVGFSFLGCFDTFMIVATRIGLKWTKKGKK
jgi:hypothetical protein